jgi:hypothetical protein
MAKAQWSDLTPIERRDFISWMDSAKEQPETHKRRIEKACAMLAAGKRRPDVFQSLKWFNFEDPDGNQVLVVQA